MRLRPRAPQRRASPASPASRAAPRDGGPGGSAKHGLMVLVLSDFICIVFFYLSIYLCIYVLILFIYCIYQSWSVRNDSQTTIIYGYNQSLGFYIGVL